MLDWVADPNAWVGLLTLSVLEVVLGVDNIIFITILAGKLPEARRARARKIGLLGAMVMRILLLLSLTWVMRLTGNLFTIPMVSGDSGEISGRDLILILGGLFLIAKSTYEIHDKLEGEEGAVSARTPSSMVGVITQIMLLDIVFSLDSVITAIGMVSQIFIMISAVVISVGFMLAFAGAIGAFVERHPTVKLLALSFLVLIGVNLLAEGFAQHIPKGYTYFAMAFSVVVEMLNLRIRAGSAKAVHLHQRV